MAEDEPIRQLRYNIYLRKTNFITKNLQMSIIFRNFVPAFGVIVESSPKEAASSHNQAVPN